MTCLPFDAKSRVLSCEVKVCLTLDLNYWQCLLSSLQFLDTPNSFVRSEKDFEVYSLLNLCRLSISTNWYIYLPLRGKQIHTLLVRRSSHLCLPHIICHPDTIHTSLNSELGWACSVIDRRLGGNRSRSGRVVRQLLFLRGAPSFPTRHTFNKSILPRNLS